MIIHAVFGKNHSVDTGDSVQLAFAIAFVNASSCIFLPFAAQTDVASHIDIADACQAAAVRPGDYFRSIDGCNCACTEGHLISSCRSTIVTDSDAASMSLLNICTSSNSSTTFFVNGTGIANCGRIFSIRTSAKTYSCSIISSNSSTAPNRQRIIIISTHITTNGQAGIILNILKNYSVNLSDACQLTFTIAFVLTRSCILRPRAAQVDSTFHINIADTCQAAAVRPFIFCTTPLSERHLISSCCSTTGTDSDAASMFLANFCILT